MISDTLVSRQTKTDHIEWIWQVVQQCSLVYSFLLFSLPDVKSFSDPHDGVVVVLVEVRHGSQSETVVGWRHRGTETNLEEAGVNLRLLKLLYFAIAAVTLTLTRWPWCTTLTCSLCRRLNTRPSYVTYIPKINYLDLCQDKKHMQTLQSALLPGRFHCRCRIFAASKITKLHQKLQAVAVSVLSVCQSVCLSQDSTRLHCIQKRLNWSTFCLGWAYLGPKKYCVTRGPDPHSEEKENWKRFLKVYVYIQGL